VHVQRRLCNTHDIKVKNRKRANVAPVFELHNPLAGWTEKDFAIHLAGPLGRALPDHEFPSKN
jgi:hypothetical protein